MLSTLYAIAHPPYVCLFLTWKLKHTNSILWYFKYFHQTSSKLILIILSYTVSKLVHFLRHGVEEVDKVCNKEMIEIKISLLFIFPPLYSLWASSSTKSLIASFPGFSSSSMKNDSTRRKPFMEYRQHNVQHHLLHKTIHFLHQLSCRAAIIKILHINSDQFLAIKQWKYLDSLQCTVDVSTVCSTPVTSRISV